MKDDFGNFKEYDDKAASYVVDYNKLDGVTVGFKGFTASAGFDYVKDENNDSLLAASATAFETAGQTLGSNAFGMM